MKFAYFDIYKMKKRQVKIQAELINYQQLSEAQNPKNGQFQEESNLPKSQAEGSLVFQLDSPKVNILHYHTQKDMIIEKNSNQGHKVQKKTSQSAAHFTYEIELGSEISEQQKQDIKSLPVKEKNQSNSQAHFPDKSYQQTANIQVDQREDRLKRRKNKGGFTDIIDESQAKPDNSKMKVDVLKENQPKNIEYGKSQEHSHSENQRTDIPLKEQPLSVKQRLQILRQQNHHQTKQIRQLPPLKKIKTKKQQQDLGFLQNNDNSIMALEKLTEQANYQAKIFNHFAFKTVSSRRNVDFIFKREKIWLKNYYHPQYSLVFNTDKLIFSARKEWGNINSLYHISCQERNYKRWGNYYAGFLTGNFTGSCFSLFSYHDQSPELVATILYKPDLKCIQPASRDLQIYIKNEDYTYNQLAGHDQRQKIGLNQLYQVQDNARARKIIKLVNKKARWCNSLNAFVMDFKGKMKMASVKNTILVEEGNESQNVLMVCKQSHTDFYIQVGHPLNPFIAMGIILSSFDFKLCCE